MAILCRHCGKEFESNRARKVHVHKVPSCKKREERVLRAALAKLARTNRGGNEAEERLHDAEDNASESDTSMNEYLNEGSREGTFDGALYDTSFDAGDEEMVHTNDPLYHPQEVGASNYDEALKENSAANRSELGFEENEMDAETEEDDGTWNLEDSASDTSEVDLKSGESSESDDEDVEADDEMRPIFANLDDVPLQASMPAHTQPGVDDVEGDIVVGGRDEGCEGQAASGAGLNPSNSNLPHFSAASNRFEVPFPTPAGTPIELGTLNFDDQRYRDTVRKENEYGPFRSKDTWELGKWLMKDHTSTARQEFFKLETNRRNPDIPWDNDKQFIKDVDQLTKGPKWKCKVMSVTGDKLDQGGRQRVEHYELWYRDILECVEELLGNPMFREHTKYAPERHFQDRAGTEPIYDEMWTGEWWWDVQKLLPPGVTIIPLMLASDATQLTGHSGDKKAWPAYITFGNFSKELRRKGSQHAMVLFAYLPVAALKCFKGKEKCREQTWNFMHRCIKEVLMPLIELGENTRRMVCPDSWIRECLLVIASWIADHPEQCLLSCCRGNRCPGCTVRVKHRQYLQENVLRNPRETLDAIKAAIDGQGTNLLKSLGLRPTWPFWAKLPMRYSNVHSWFWPEVLHQVTKGMLDHMLDWLFALSSKIEIDSRAQTLPPHPGQKHFSKGLSEVSQWTGNEFRVLVRILMAISIHAVPHKVLIPLRAFINFTFLSYLHRHTKSTVSALQHELEVFHAHKEVFLEENGGPRKDFNFTKFHSILHYPAAIPQIGSLDATTSEYSERAHIDFAKHAYAAVRKTDFIRFMTIWLDRQEAIQIRTSYIMWVQKQSVLTQEPAVADVDSDPELDMEDAEANLPDDAPDFVTLTNGSPNHFIAKQPNLRPKSKLHPREMVATFRLLGFLDTLNNFLKGHGKPAAVERHSFRCWTRFQIRHSKIYDFGDSQGTDQICATPPPVRDAKNKDPRTSKGGAYQTALLLIDRSKAFPHCYQVVQVRTIFSFPNEFGDLEQGHFAFVELFTKFPKNPHKESGFYPVSRLPYSSRDHSRPQSQIVSISDIHFGCQLAPKVNKASEIKWTSEEALDKCANFYFNSDSSYRLWALSNGSMTIDM